MNTSPYDVCKLSFYVKIFLDVFICMHECFAFMYVYVPVMCLDPVPVRRVCQISDSQNLEFCIVVSFQDSARNQTQVSSLKQQQVLLTAEPSLQ